MKKYICTDCKTTFYSEGNKKEWTDPIYGPCMKYVTECPDCKTECNEYRDPAAAKKSAPVPQPAACNGACHSCGYAN